MALEPGGLRNQMVTAAADGELKLIDFRMLGDAGGNAPAGLANGGNAPGGSMGVWKTVSASATSRNLSALAAHPNAPLLATGTSTQVRLACAAAPHAGQLTIMSVEPSLRGGSVLSGAVLLASWALSSGFQQVRGNPGGALILNANS